jgi:alpha-D-ribose 1-methylphosphonate 5-triphosphate synthase subunit PhnH
MTATDTYTGAFTDPVLDAQAAFRVVMDCMARPGTIGWIEGGARGPKPLGRAQSAIALTLFDQDTPVYLSPALAKAGVAPWLGFQTGAAATDLKSEARFALIEAGAPFPALASFGRGSQDYPDRSTTVIVELETLEGGEELTLAGPGIRERITISPKGLPGLFPALWAENHALYPRGVDLILTSGRACLCLPRSARILTVPSAQPGEIA